MNTKLLLAALAVIMLIAAGCGGSSGNGNRVDNGNGGNESSTPVAQGSRILGMNVKEVPSVDYTTAYSQAMTLGAREVSVSLDWGELEPSVGAYDNTILGIIDAFYSIQTGDLTLVLRPLDTPGPSMPADLTGRSYDDPDVIAAFENFLANLHAQLNTLNASGKLKWIQIGNEIDAYLGTDSTRWSQWQTFFQAAKAKIRSLWGTSIRVSSIIQFSMLNDITKLSFYYDLLPDLDTAVLTYYPLKADFTMRPVSTVAGDFQLMVDTIPGKEILLQECGYPSSTDNDSSEAQQADFISAVFAAWDTHIGRIRYIELAWQYDVSSTTIDQWVIDYGIAGSLYETAFRSYVGTLGLNNYDGTEKMAMPRLRQELQERSWGSSTESRAAS